MAVYSVEVPSSCATAGEVAQWICVDVFKHGAISANNENLWHYKVPAFLDLKETLGGQVRMSSALGSDGEIWFGVAPVGTTGRTRTLRLRDVLEVSAEALVVVGGIVEVAAGFVPFKRAGSGR